MLVIWDPSGVPIRIMLRDTGQTGRCGMDKTTGWQALRWGSCAVLVVIFRTRNRRTTNHARDVTGSAAEAEKHVVGRHRSVTASCERASQARDDDAPGYIRCKNEYLCAHADEKVAQRRIVCAELGTAGRTRLAPGTSVLVSLPDISELGVELLDGVDVNSSKAELMRAYDWFEDMAHRLLSG